MLPSHGLFRSIPCPFFLAGLCERPHCAFRHCRSDIRIDRKIEAEALNDFTSESNPPHVSKGDFSLPSTKHAAVLGYKVPVSNKESPSNNNKSESEISNKELQKKRLKSALSSESNRKRSRDSESDESGKRRRVSVDSGDMGQNGSKDNKDEKSGEQRSENKRRDRHKKDELDLLVEEIEKSGKSSQHKRKSKKHKHKRRTSDEGSNNSEASSSSTNQRKDDKQKVEKSKDEKPKDEKARDEKKRRDDKKDSKRNQSKEDEHRKRRDMKKRDSSDSPKENKRIRKSSILESDDSSRRSSEKSSPKGKESSSKNDVKPQCSKDASPASTETSQKGLDTLTLSSQDTVNTINRFSALVENSADESAYNSDIFDDSLEFKYPGGSDSDDDPEMVARECLELFENYKAEIEEKPADEIVEIKKDEDPDEGFCVVGKKRVAHLNSVIKPVQPKRQHVTSRNLKDNIIKRVEDQAKKSTNNGSNAGPPRAPPPGKCRIAHVPNAGKLAQKPTLNQSSSSSNTSALHSISNASPGQPGSLTYSQTAAKGVKREAHKPSAVITAKKTPLVYKDALNKSTKIPHVTRQQILDKMFAEYSRIFVDHQVAFDATVQRENELISKCSSKQVYLSSGISIISGLRKTGRETNVVGSNRTVSHEQILSGSLEAKNCSVRIIKKDDSLPQGNGLYRALQKYVMTKSQLEENGYPRHHPSGEPGRAIAKARPGEENSMTLRRRICDRCKKRYETTDDGDHVILEVCNYHWGRKYNVKARGGRGARESSYSCCGSDDDKMGCATAVSHVSKNPVPITSQKGFVEAVLGEELEENMGLQPWDIVGIDCEMVYTTHGNELARVTVVGVDLKVLYDEIVRPTHRVLDCNTRFSGITHDDMDKAKRSITEIQAIILTHLRPNTIIIGHSLESDLLALRLKHECVIDTSILYPHRMGPPKKRALKTLSAEILKKVIQELETGHDSAEDAQIAVELVLAKLKSDKVK